MKLLRNFSIIFIVASFLASCDEGITGSGPVVTDTYSIPYFTSIECNTPGRINLLQGSNQSLSLTTNDNLFRYFDIYVSNSKLIIEQKRSYNIQDYDELRFDITMPEIYKITLNGSASLWANNRINTSALTVNLDGSGYLRFYEATTPRLTINNEGSGYIDFDRIYTDELTAALGGSGRIAARDCDVINVHTEVDGSGIISLTGIADIVDGTINGSGELRLVNLPCLEAYFTINGSGSAETSPQDKLTATINGSGSVYYTKQPTIITKITGSGIVSRY